MKKLFLVLLAVGLMGTSFISCREKTTGEKIEDVADDIADDVKDAVN